MAGNVIYPWKRYWVKQGENPAMENGLFCEPTAAIRWLSPTSNGVGLSELKDVPCLVLLGDVGMGKSTTLENEAQELGKTVTGQKHAVVYIDLKRLSETQIERRIFGNADVESWLRGEHSLTLFLDSLDECWRRIDALEHLLVNELNSRIRAETPPLSLRLACRSAEWRGDAGKTLERLFSKRAASNPPVQVFVLAPLSANNVKDAAKSNNFDGNLLLERIVAKEAQGLVSHPITLEMLLQIYNANGDFPKSRVELYRDGCLRLCADNHLVFGAAQNRKTTPEHRFAIASRLAALSVFTNRFQINGDAEHPLARPDVLEIAEIVGHADEKVAGGRVVVDRDTITETLQTALFAERFEGAQTWRHQSYAEFLAADYAAHRGLPATQTAAILTDTADNAQRIIPQLEETACWTAEISPAVFELLAARNADVLLRCDPTYWKDQHRALLVGSYLELVRRHEAAELDWQLKHRFAHLAHRGLAAQLGPVITDRGENPLVRECAIDIAGYCKLEALAPELVNVFLDSADIFRVRKHAAVALWHARNDEIRTLLKQKNVSNWSGDIDDDLKGYYLQTMWPSHASLDELMPLPPPKRRNYSGSYKMFLEYELPKSLPDAELPRMLDWFRENNVSFDITSTFGYLPSKLFVRALDRMNVSAVRDAVLRLLSHDEHQLHHLFRGKVDAEEISAEARLNFWRAVVQSELDIQKLVIYADRHSTGMLQRNDAFSFISEYRTSVDERIRNRWRALIFWVFSIEDAAVMDALVDLAQTDKSIAEDLVARTSCPLVPDDKNWMKQNYERQQKRYQAEQVAKPSLTESLVNALDAFESGAIDAFWTVGELLDCDPEKLEGGFAFLTIQFSEGKAWKSLPPEVQERILRGVPVYIRGQAVEETQVWDGAHRYRPYDVFSPLLILLYDENRQALDDLAGEDWSKWTSVLFAYSSRRNGSHDEAYKVILSQAFSKARQPFLAALKRFLEAEINNDSERRIIWFLGAVWCGEIKRLLLDLFGNKPLKPTAAQDILQLFASQEPKEAERLLVSLVEELDCDEKASVYAPVAFVLLLTNLPTTWAVPLLGRIKHNPPLGQAVVPRLIRGHHQPSGWLSEIPPRELADFWDWLNQNYPGDPYEKDDGGGSVTINHDIYHFRNGVFQTLTRSGTLEACDAMVELMRRKPNAFWLGDILAEMRKTTHRKAWVRPSPSALMQLFAKVDKRLVRTAGELHGLVLESLRRFESELHGSSPSMELWNETTKDKQKFWQPKDEMNLSSCLKRFLERDLKEHGVIADREVQIRPRLGIDPAQLIDVLVRAVPFDEDGKSAPPVSVVVELKCAWNEGVLLDMERQLYDRYLKNSDMHFGIYAVAHFWCDAWNWENDGRKSKSENRTAIPDLTKTLSAQAVALTSSQKLVESMVIDARLSLA